MEHSKEIIIGIAVVGVILLIMHSHNSQDATDTGDTTVNVYNPRINAHPGMRPHPRVTPNVNPVDTHLIGGCAGTRYGCCPGGQKPKINYAGTNCRV